ncbi:MAG: XshC-Cox1 family protein [Acidimicrobiaceae bacterium]|nr:XshC-Cox1 family protein [Acidimicrobiaceae bacterium]
MRVLLDELERWRSEGRRVSLARVVSVRGSGPRELGATLAVNERGEVAGSVSTGCVESAVVSEAMDVINGGAARMCTYEHADDDVFAVGLTCGGAIDVFVAPFDPPTPVFETLLGGVRRGEALGLATVVAGDTGAGDSPRALGASLLLASTGVVAGSLGHPALDRLALDDLRAALKPGEAAVRCYRASDPPVEAEVSVFIESFAASPRLILIGATDFTAALANQAHLLGYRVTVSDPRGAFATRARFPIADKVIVDWPDRCIEAIRPPLGPRDALCVLTHDAKLDIPAITSALQTGVGYIGAMGSRATVNDRVTRLVSTGVTADALKRVRMPIGLDLGATTPEETAVSICAEIIASRHERSNPAPLQETSGPIHRASLP